ncbi:MAG: hypothetical protein IKR19_08125 [Acholeplasmatales bacterium]|nr:hypothetical protein [Acholeplasmatales bacterium]
MSIFEQYLGEIDIVNESISVRNIKEYVIRFFEHFQKLIYIRHNYNNSWPNSIFQSSKNIRDNYKVVQRDIINKQKENNILDETYAAAIQKLKAGSFKSDAQQIPLTRPEFLTFEFISNKDLVREYLISSINNNPNTHNYSSYSDSQIIDDINNNYHRY